MKLWPFAFALAAAFFHSALQAQESFECAAEKAGVRYTVKLWGASDHRSMSVSESTGSVTSGRATAYRRNTRFFLPSGGDSGFKLGIDGDSASLCFANGGTDCRRCTPLPSRRERYTSKSTCVTHGARGRVTATLFYTGEPTSEMVIEDEVGVVASGPAAMSARSETVARLRTGPSEGYAYLSDANFLCDYEGRDCYPCETVENVENPAQMPLPVDSLAQCTFAGIDAILTEQGGDSFLLLDYHQRESGAGSEEGWYVGPATYLGHDRWQFESYSLSLFGTSAELCTVWEGCGTCEYLR